MRSFYLMKNRIAAFNRSWSAAVLIALLALCANTGRAEPSLQLGGQRIAQLAIDQLHQEAEVRWPNATITVTLEPLRIKPQPRTCSEIDITSRHDRGYGRVPLTITCRAPVHWQTFRMATVDVELPVVVTKAPIGRKHALSSNDLVLESRNLQSLRRDFLTSKSSAVGQQSRRPLGSGSVIYQSGLMTPLTVQKGQQVAISGGQGSIRIQAKGRALQAGRRGEQILVRNLQSGREFQAWVVAPGQVSSHWSDPKI